MHRYTAPTLHLAPALALPADPRRRSGVGLPRQHLTSSGRAGLCRARQGEAYHGGYTMLAQAQQPGRCPQGMQGYCRQAGAVLKVALPSLPAAAATGRAAPGTTPPRCLPLCGPSDGCLTQLAGLARSALRGRGWWDSHPCATRCSSRRAGSCHLSAALWHVAAAVARLRCYMWVLQQLWSGVRCRATVVCYVKVCE
jgi:hypothetical protein